MKRRWLFADQLGPHFLDSPGQPVLLVESKAVFRRRAFHRQKAHLVLSALRHRAADGDDVRLVRTETYREAVTEPLSVCHPTSRAARAFVQNLPDVEMLPPRGFVTAPQDFVSWADGRKHLRMEDFYRFARQHHGVLMDGGEPAGSRWNYDADNREPPPARLDVPAPPPIVEDEIDQEVRADLDRWERDEGIEFVGRDGPRLFPATRREALARLRHFVQHRLPTFGPYEDAMLAGDPFLAHSMLSAPINLGLLDPVEVIERAESAYRAGEAPLNSVEGFVRQILGWRDFIWHLYWYFEPTYRAANELRARKELPKWFASLNAEAVEARCLSDVLAGVRDRGWVHHIPRLMVLGNYAMQRGWRPGAVADWLHRCFVDGYEWVMTANVVGMSQFADGGRMSTKPYAAGGAYINRMSDYCGGCRYDPKVRVGENACPYTAGYWHFLARHEDALRGNHRLRQPLQGLRRLTDLDALVEQEDARGSRAP
ncbi:cryptochrome/photolyase family protein [Cryptosporangium phraense]|uniref:Cryptochrome/photolyase family protein n=1 Tax=Cryptosporangium phraense TaxID=2593070 RepID=A0A545AGL6_9ACTN|nr:cryptochrome/photolyase family protein [Cryptosporangium phraense]TQS40410.1 cryptochrome/photolyase family protein [Cryptosporangium phraense]